MRLTIPLSHHEDSRPWKSDRFLKAHFILNLIKGFIRNTKASEPDAQSQIGCVFTMEVCAASSMPRRRSR